jgi:hypothetical protein
LLSGRAGTGGTAASRLYAAFPCPWPPPPARRFTDAAGRAGTARLLVGLGVAPGGRPCRELLQRINGEPGFMAVDVSDMDLAQASFLDSNMCLWGLALAEQRQQDASGLGCRIIVLMGFFPPPPLSLPLHLPPAAGAPAAHGGRSRSAGWRRGAG